MVLTAATKDQSAIEGRHGFFTHALLEVLDTRSAVSIAEVGYAVRQRTAASARAAKIEKNRIDWHMLPQLQSLDPDLAREFVFVPKTPRCDDYRPSVPP
jgi:hypothetical protein